ncbi:MAG: hypothetical protein ACUVXG_06700 [Anaerolineae bacterium]
MSPFSRGLIFSAWIAATALVFCLYMIARFFQQKSGERSYYQLFLVPLGLYLVTAFRCVVSDADFAVNLPSDALLFLAGASTVTLGSYLYNLMTGGRK